MVARNLVEVENNPLYPRADQFGGDKTGIFGSEFPLLQEGIVLLSSVFGYDHWYGRLINLIVTSFGIYFFYLLLLTILPERAAFYSGIMLLTSLWFMFGRKIMPDTFSVSLALSGIYMAYLYSMREMGSSPLILFIVHFWRALKTTSLFCFHFDSTFSFHPENRSTKDNIAKCVCCHRVADDSLLVFCLEPSFGLHLRIEHHVRQVIF